jgi:zinc protease
MNRWMKLSWVVALVVFAASVARAAMAPIPYTLEKLDNGLTVIYAPMQNAPVVHVRVLYHVGSRNEKEDRQGFAHMFEHMMFRGSAHVAPEEHMKTISALGGNCNAFTSFDETVYVNTLPTTGLQTTLYLEADRMASFKVNDTIFQTERKVVAEEWRMRYGNQPLGTLYQDFTKLAYTTHSYRWTPIGDMDQLRRASSSELQEFFNTYYVPNNACLVIAGEFDVEKTKGWVHQCFGWIPKGPDTSASVPQEPPQKETRRLVVYKANVPLTNIYMGFKTTNFKSDDHYALELLGDILASGRTGILDRKFVTGDNPTCLNIGAGDEALEDTSLFILEAAVHPGKDPDRVEKDVLAAVYEVAEKGVTQDELDKVRTQTRQNLIRSRETCTQIATELGQQQVFGGDANRVNEMLGKYDALTPADLQAVAKKYFKPEGLTIVHYRPDPLGINARKAAATQAAEAAKKANETKNAPVAPSTEPVKPRVDHFPDGYPTRPPAGDEIVAAKFNHGEENAVGAVKVITLTDHRLPLVTATLVMRGGGDTEPDDKVGLAGITAQMMRRGSGSEEFLTLSNELESHGIDIEAQDGGDFTTLGLSCTTDQLGLAVEKANLILTQPTFPQAELEKIKQQAISGLTQALSNPAAVVEREMRVAAYEGSPQGRVATPQSLAAVSLEDVKKSYAVNYELGGAFIVISGDVSAEQGKQVAEKLLKGFDRPAAPIKATYALKSAAAEKKIILIDNPEGRQSAVRMSNRGYDIHSQEKYAGTIAGQILSSGIESRLNKYVRAEKGLTYGCRGYFMPNRHAGEFAAAVDTNPETTLEAIQAMIKVFNDMKAAEVTPEELTQAKSRTAGAMVMETQTIQQQAGRRTEQVLDDYPIDYYDQYATHVAAVKADQVENVVKEFVKPDEMIYIVVAPAKAVKEQLEKLGAVEVRPMPLNRTTSARGG